MRAAERRHDARERIQKRVVSQIDADDGACGAIIVIQRFGSALNANQLLPRRDLLLDYRADGAHAS